MNPCTRLALLLMIFLVLSEVTLAKHHRKRKLELSAPSRDERKLFVDPLMFAMNPMMNPMAMHFPLNSDKKYSVKHNLHVVHGPYGMNPYMMGGMMGMMGGMMNPYMMGGMMNPYMMGMMNPYMMGGMMGMMGGMMNPYMMGMMNPYMMGGMMHGMMGGAYMHPGMPGHLPEEEERQLIETPQHSEEDKLAAKLYDQMIEEKEDAAKGGIKVDF